MATTLSSHASLNLKQQSQVCPQNRYQKQQDRHFVSVAPGKRKSILSALSGGVVASTSRDTSTFLPQQVDLTRLWLITPRTAVDTDRAIATYATISLLSIFSSTRIEEKMPRLNVEKLIQTLRSHCARLHEIYVDTTNIQISERLMSQIIYLENLLAQLETINV